VVKTEPNPLPPQIPCRGATCQAAPSCDLGPAGDVLGFHQ
jgi:hypothetical protein